MKKVITILILLLFFTNTNGVINGSINALNIWSKNIFPILFPTLILSDFIISSGIFNDLSKYIKLNSNFFYILFISILSGTPSNAKNLLNLYNNDSINKKDINIILSSCIIYNPLFVIKFTSLKIYLIILASNIITIIFNYKKLDKYNINMNKKFNLNESISSNINILFNILGTITVFFVLANILKTNYIYLNIIISSLLETTTGLVLINRFITDVALKNILYLFALSFGGISIFIQIKSILKDTFNNYNLYFINRLIVFIISVIIYKSIDECNISLLLSDPLKYLFNFITNKFLFLFPNDFR